MIPIRWLALTLALAVLCLTATSGLRAQDEDADTKVANQHIAKLASDDYQTREDAMDALEKMGKKALPALKAARDADPGPDVEWRLDDLIEAAGGNGESAPPPQQEDEPLVPDLVVLFDDKVRVAGQWVEPTPVQQETLDKLMGNQPPRTETREYVRWAVEYYKLRLSFYEEQLAAKQKTGSKDVPKVAETPSDDPDLLYLVRQHGLWGYADADGQIVISAQFSSATRFRYRSAVVRYNDKWMVIDGGARVRATPECDTLREFEDGMGVFSRTVEGRTLWGVLELDGSELVPPTYADMRDFHHGLAAVKGLDGTWGFMQRDGSLAVKPQYADVGDFRDDYAAVCRDGHWGYIDRSGREVIKPTTWAAALPFGYGLAPVRNEAGKFGFVRGDGSVAIEPRFDEARPFVNGLAAVRLNDSWGFIDIAGRMAVEATFEAVRDFADDRAPAMTNGKWGYIGPRGLMKIEPGFVEAQPFHRGRALVTRIADGRSTLQCIRTSGAVTWSDDN